MKRFGFTKVVKKNWKWYARHIHVSFFLLCVVSFSVFSLYFQVSGLLFRHHEIDVFEESIHDVAGYFTLYDNELSEILLDLENIIKSYKQGENIFHTHRHTIDEVVSYIISNEKYLTKLGFSPYQGLFKFLNDAWQYKTQLYTLLGANETKNYLIILQNTAEKRPNGGFFGSFAFVSLSGGQIEEFEIMDSYYPNWIAPDIKIQAPSRSYRFIPDKLIGFVSANKFGFTHIDGRNIKNLYNQIFTNPSIYERKQNVIQQDLIDKTFDKTVHGVIFVRSDVLTHLIPGLEKLLREWQFINANTDILKKKYADGNSTGYSGDFSHKKANYIHQVSTFFLDQKEELFKNIIHQFTRLTSHHYLNIYIDDASFPIDMQPLQKLLDRYKLKTPYSTGMIYLRDSNDSFSKSDRFISKSIALYDAQDQLVHPGDNDMIAVNNLEPGTYFLKITYNFTVPQEYIAFISGLQTKYNITMTSRELGILALQPAKHFVTGKEKRWATRSTVYLPPHITVQNVVGDVIDRYRFTPTFANGLYYETEIIKNNTSKGIRLVLEVK